MAEPEAVQFLWVKKAQAGEQESLAALAGVAREKVYSYLNRVTLDPELAADLTQDTVVAVLQSIGGLKQQDLFWPWVFKIASNKVRQHFRHESLRKTASLSMVEDVAQPGEKAVASELSRSELAEITRAAMARLPERYRMILALRFYEGLPYNQVSDSLECSPLAARATLLRAKNALKRELRRRGVASSAFVLALVAFGQATVWPGSASAAAITVSGVAALWAGVVTAKVKLAGTVAAIILLASVGWTFFGEGMAAPASSGSGPVRGVHFAQHSLCTLSDPVNFGATRSNGVYEHTISFPEGPDGPFFSRLQRWDPREKNRLCWWIENGDANYYIHSGQKTIYIHNDKSCSYSTMCLPTDSPEFAAFIRSVEGPISEAPVERADFSYQRDPATGRIIAHEDRRFPELGPHRVRYDYSDPDPGLFESPTGMPIIDQRDEMHKRGWALFQMDGMVEGRAVAGSGQLPLVYNATREHPPWLKLTVGGKVAGLDTGRKAWLNGPDGKPVRICDGGGLFKGLSRPWSGFHTLDSIRRDAAAERVWFSVEFTGNLATLTLIDDRRPVQYMLRYTVDIQRDLLEDIEIWRGPQGKFDQLVGRLQFRYETPGTGSSRTGSISEPEGEARRFQDGASPPRPEPGDARDSATVLWPLDLLGGDGGTNPTG